MAINFKNLFANPGETIKGSIATPGGLLGQGSLVSKTGDALVGRYSNSNSAPALLGDTLSSIYNNYGQRTSAAEATNQGLVDTVETPWGALGLTEEEYRYRQAILDSMAGNAGGGAGGSDRSPLPGQAGYQPNIQYFNGVQYDLNDPAQRQSFAQVRSQYADQLYGQQVGQYDQELAEALADAESQYGSAYAGLDQDFGNLRRNIEDYETGYKKNVAGLGENFSLGQVKRQNYFSGLSPLAYQSSQGTSEGFAKTKYDEGISDLARARERSMTQFGQQEADLTNERENLKTGYNRFLDTSRRGAEQFRTNLRNTLNTQRDDLASGLSAADVSQGVGRFNYGRQQFNPFQGEAVDLGKYTQYTDFNSLAQSPQANYFKAFKPAYAKQGDPLQNYLGYEPEKKEEDHIKKYLGY